MKRSILFAVLVAFCLVENTQAHEDSLISQFIDHFNSFHRTGVQSIFLAETIAKYAIPRELMFTNYQEGNVARQPRTAFCTLCKLVVNTILNGHENGDTTDEIGVKLVNLCESLNLSTNRVCEGTIDANLPVLDFILNNTPNLTANRMCSMILQADECGVDDPNLDWSIDLGSTPKPLHLPFRVPQLETRVEPFTVIHLTDIHYDPNYLIGGNAHCGEPMCCRFDQGVPEFPNTTAGRWGDYNLCDIPFEVVTDALEHITTTHTQIDYVYMTGDLIDHGVWDTSYSRNNATFVKVLTELKRTFGDIPVFPCFGNHEPHPLNVFAPVSITDPTISTAWLYETMADLWSQWLPADTRETILAGGFYTVLVRPGFRVVALNNMQCYVYNWFLFYDHADPDGQLQWLVGVLQAAETAGEKVHLLYHIPTGNYDCYRIWSREYNRIVNRFEATITGQFNGHTHHDELHVYYDSEVPSRAINVAYTAGSLTSYSDVNVNYRVYTVDGDSLNVIDHDTWIYNMTEANLSPLSTPNWFKMYSFREAYNVADLSPTTLDILARSMALDEETLQQYFRYFYLQGDPKLEKGCDADCRDKLLCEMVRSDVSDSTQCDEILAISRAARLPGELTRV